MADRVDTTNTSIPDWLRGDLAARIGPLLAGVTVGGPGGQRPEPDPRPEPDIDVDVSTGDGRLELSIDGSQVFATEDLGALVHQLVWELTQRAVARPAAGLVLHAALVSRDGADIVVSGPSGSGKSTLAAALAERGATYVTDEATYVDRQGVPRGGFVRPIHLDHRSVALLGLAEQPGDVTMPGGGRYTLPRRWSAHATSDGRPLVLLLGQLGGALEAEPARRSDAIAHLVRERFAVSPTTQDELAILKELSGRVDLVTVRGGSVMDRAYLAETLATQDKVIASG
jgi:energy-coupling factor transporter ATP-binding protein EcfA2